MEFLFPGDTPEIVAALGDDPATRKCRVSVLSRTRRCFKTRGLQAAVVEVKSERVCAALRRYFRYCLQGIRRFETDREIRCTTVICVKEEL